MLPLLQFLADKKEHSLRETIEHLELKFELNDDDKKQSKKGVINPGETIKF